MRPQQLDYLFYQIRCCKVRVRRKRKQENGIYRETTQITKKQCITKRLSLQYAKRNKNETKQKGDDLVMISTDIRRKPLIMKRGIIR